MATQLASMGIVGILTALTFLDQLPLGTIYVLGALSGAAVVFDASPRNALTFQLVGRQQLQNAVALNAGTPRWEAEQRRFGDNQVTLPSTDHGRLKLDAQPA